MNYPIVKITWTTSHRTFAELTTLAIVKAGITVVETIGFLISETEYFIVLARDIITHPEDVHQYRDVITIPKGQIKESIVFPQLSEETPT